MRSFLVRGVRYTRTPVEGGYQEKSEVVVAFYVQARTSKEAVWKAIQEHKKELGRVHQILVGKA